jgi:serine/threonine protein phosphatase PrpC
MADKPNILPSTPAVEIAVRTDPGRDPEKQVNEDASAHAEVKLGLLAVVCDGMGGHAGGKEASELAVKSIVEIITAAPEKTAPRDALRVAIEEANRRVWGMPTNEGGYRPGSTVVAILAHSGGAEIAHVGDSRIYLVHSGAITQVSKDHSMVQEMVDRKIIKAEEAATHPDANKIMRALGIAKDVEVDVRPEPILFVAGDVFILCSDGLSDLVTATEILDIAGSRPAAQAAGQLVDLANARGGHDNITAMVVRMKGTASAGDAATIVKTIPLTAHEPVSGSPGAGSPASASSSAAVPPDQGSGPRGTVLTAPLQPTSSPNVDVPAAVKTVLAAPVDAAPRRDAAAAIPRAPSSPPPSERGERSKAPLVAGIVLVLVALGIVAMFVWSQQRPHRAPVVVVPFDPADASRPAPSEEDAGMVAPDITLAPVLAPPSGVKVPWWKDPDASTPTGEPRDCAIARWQKDAGRPEASWAPLEAKCRAAGGKI